VVFRLFPYKFENNTSKLYFNLLIGSITRWNEFEKYFIGKFGEEKTPMALFKELQPVNENKEKLKDFKQLFITVINKFTFETTPFKALVVEYYTSSLLPSIYMFIK
jgi:hypothetical protein